jgi:hypothetical protein
MAFWLINSFFGQAEENKQLVENHKLITDDEIEQLQNEVHQLLRSKIEVSTIGIRIHTV